MGKMKINQNHRANFKKLKDAEREDDEALMVAYDKEREEQVLLIGSLFEGRSSKLEYEPHAVILDMDERQIADRYVLASNQQEFESYTK